MPSLGPASRRRLGSPSVWLVAAIAAFVIRSDGVPVRVLGLLLLYLVVGAVVLCGALTLARADESLARAEAAIVVGSLGTAVVTLALHPAFPRSLMGLTMVLAIIGVLALGRFDGRTREPS